MSDLPSVTGGAAPLEPSPDAALRSETLAGRGLGAAMALAAANPVWLSESTTVPRLVVWLLLLGVFGTVAWFAAPPVVARPVTGNVLWRTQLSRHRNTVLAVGFVVVVAPTAPPVWLMAWDAALLLAYLLFVDAAAGGPPGLAQLRDWPTVLGAFAAQGLVLTGAVMSIAAAGSWARGLAAVLVLVVTATLAIALRRTPPRR
ncbi:hypothetical protein [Streptacidiphilus rugosus]|uniref:hypothetical protein n=1 Tax=Streptacidiphilus rugosus TaxID=405783 RepID=UPI00068CA37F|nr:hypothetical protein [Streptacidiphilus rugosus]